MDTNKITITHNQHEMENVRFRVPDQQLGTVCHHSPLHELTDTNTFKRQLKPFFLNKHNNRSNTSAVLRFTFHVVLFCTVFAIFNF